MQVILLEKIARLGDVGDQVAVKPGYARNYLLAYGKAIIANAENKARVEAQRAELERSRAQALAEARSRAEQLGGATVQIARKVSEEGTLFGSVSTKDIVDAMREKGLEIARSEIHLPAGPVKDLGDHEVTVTLHPEVDVKIIVSVVEET